MNQTDIGRFIAKRRKEKSLTQAQLAQMLNITDRAVSKWENGKCLPDSAIMLELCKILGITADELLSGEKISIESCQEKADENQTVLKKKSQNNLSRNVIISILLSAVFLAGIITCLICNVAVAGSLTWSLISTVSIAFAWIISLPTVISGRNGSILSLSALSIFIVPYLWLLSRLMEARAVFSISTVSIAVVSIIFLWIVFVIFHRARKLMAIGLTFLLLIPLTVVINVIVSRMIDVPVFDVWDFISTIVLLAAAFLLFACDYVKINRHEK